MGDWNSLFTNLIRSDRPAYWGNWGLNMQIKPGAVGIVDTNSGDFKVVAEGPPNLKTSDIKSNPISSTWNLYSEHVTKEEFDVKFDGSVVDPDTGTKIEAGLKVEWNMASKGCMASEFSLDAESEVLDFGSIIEKNMDWMVQKAKSVNMASDNKIAQGFGMVTGVLFAKSGLNVGSLEDNSQFSIAGSVKGINAMLGKGEGKGNYLKKTQNKSMDLHIWPDKKNIAPSHPVPIAFTFASIEGDLVIPNWITRLQSFELFLNNKPGCTYITTIDIGYDSPAGHSQNKHKLSGGLNKTVCIPLNAKNIVINVNFKGVINDDNYSFHWDAPLGQWLNGRRQIVMEGVWPSTTHCHEIP